MFAETRGVTSDAERRRTERDGTTYRAVAAFARMFSGTEQSHRLDVGIVGQFLQGHHRHAGNVDPIAEGDPFAGGPLGRLFLDHLVEDADVLNPVRQPLKARVVLERCSTRESVEVLPVAI